ncbi:MAG: hypothetical protein HKO68_02780 [Desulfobacterales bacterium]|nr:hypothetical protein [Desulfobacterales bacterium]
MRRPLKLSFAVTVISVLVFIVIHSAALAEQKPYTIVQMTTPFGSPMYTEGTAMEEVFKKAGSWVSWKVQETPGAMFVQRYYFENKDKMIAGKVPPVVTSFSASVMPFVIEGRKPFDKYPVPFSGALFSSPSFITLYATFDPDIKSAKDFSGKKVGIAEKSRPFTGVLAHMPYFAKGLGIWKKVGWQFIGPVNSKDALLNDRIDVHSSTFRAKVELSDDGGYVCTKMAPATPTMELMNSGRKLHFVGYDPEIIKKSYDFSKDMMVYPVLIKKGAYEGIEQDIWGLIAIGLYRAPSFLPDDVVKEIIRVRHEYRDELAKYHAILKFFPENPYPVGVPEKWVIPSVTKAMKELNLSIPKGK